MDKLNLQFEFENLPYPNDEANNYFEGYPINGYLNHRLAKDVEGRPLLLISVKNSTQIKNEYLTNLEIKHNVNCEIENNEVIENHNFSLIRCKSLDSDLQRYFLKICELLLPIIGEKPKNSSIIEAINKLKELFRILKEPSKATIQGLWAELFLIFQSNIPDILINSWHLVPEDTFDFRFENIRLDVKSSILPDRKHKFNLKQLAPIEGFDSYVVSILIEEHSNGKSIEDLVRGIEEKVKDDQLVASKLKTQVYKTLGVNALNISNYIFDENIASESLKLYETKVIPRIKNVPPNIYDVNFKTDLNDVHDLVDMNPDLLFTNLRP